MSLPRKPKALIVLALIWITAECRGQVTVGYGTSTQGDTLDTALTTYVFLSNFGTEAIGLTVSSWSFYTGWFEGSKNITPLIWERSGEGTNFTLRGIGATQAVTGNMVYSDVPFDLQSGSNLILTGAFYFGWKDGTTTEANTGVISWDDLGGETIQTAYAWGNEAYQNFSDPVSASNIGDTFNLGNTSLGERTYRFSATAIPEPATIALALGGTALAIVGSQRKRSRPAPTGSGFGPIVMRHPFTTSRR